MKTIKEIVRANTEDNETPFQQVSDEEAHCLARRDNAETERELQDPEAEIPFAKEELEGVLKGMFGEKGQSKNVEPTDPYDDDDDDEDDDSISGLVGGAIGMVVGGIAGLIGGIALGSMIKGNDDIDDDDEIDEGEGVEVI